MKETQKDSNKKTTSNPKEQQNKDIFTKPATKKFRNKSVNKYKVSINPNLKRNLLKLFTKSYHDAIIYVFKIIIALYKVLNG